MMKKYTYAAFVLFLLTLVSVSIGWADETMPSMEFYDFMEKAVTRDGKLIGIAEPDGSICLYGENLWQMKVGVQRDGDLPMFDILENEASTRKVSFPDREEIDLEKVWCEKHQAFRAVPEGNNEEVDFLSVFDQVDMELMEKAAGWKAVVCDNTPKIVYGFRICHHSTGGNGGGGNGGGDNGSGGNGGDVNPTPTPTAPPTNPPTNPPLDVELEPTPQPTSPSDVKLPEKPEPTKAPQEEQEELGNDFPTWEDKPAHNPDTSLQSPEKAPADVQEELGDDFPTWDDKPAHNPDGAADSGGNTGTNGAPSHNPDESSDFSGNTGNGGAPSHNDDDEVSLPELTSASRTVESAVTENPQAQQSNDEDLGSSFDTW